MTVATERLAELHQALPNGIEGDILEPVRFSLGIAASADGIFRGGIFIRDMQRTAEDRLPLDPEIAEKTLWVAAYTQGILEDPVNDQEPDKVIHEYRDISFLPQDAIQELEQVFEALRHWTHTPPNEKVKQVRYYGAYDPTINHAILAGEYTKKYPARVEEFLNAPLNRIDGTTITIRESVYRSVNWVERKMRAYPQTILRTKEENNEEVPKFLGYKRMKQTGIPHPIWKDSNLSGIHPDGTPANINDFIVDTHLQTLAITSLLSGATLKRLEAISLPEEDPRKKELCDDAERWETLAYETHWWIEKELWMEDENYPALGLDRDENGNARQIKTLTTGGMEILKTAFFDKRFWKGREEERIRKLEGIIDHITGEEFLTDGGPVVMSFKHAELIKEMGYVPYHSIVNWAKNVKEGIDGLRKQGLYQTALGMSYLLRRSIAIYQAIHGSDYYPEFSYVNTTNRRLIYNVVQLPKDRSIIDSATEKGTNMPVTRQTWTASAIEAEKNYIRVCGNNIPNYESESLRNIDEKGSEAIAAFIELLPSMEEQVEHAKQNPVFIDVEGGIQKEAEYLARFGRGGSPEAVTVIYDPSQGSPSTLVA